ncbi:MAG TPA: MurR/RpiR family transcriptional regulator [Acidimicrobiales bacterium]|jgi:DNA-binding MurR/RpiR family transcriptional regulator|nr:MurR/RpiR family transcriptional regulator [Acidimicrobiales bacterium]
MAAKAAGRPDTFRSDKDEAFSAFALIRSGISSLAPAEAQVAQVILDRPYEALEWSAAELGANANTSSATAVRACRRLGFDGLPQLRLALARDLGWSRMVPAATPSEPLGILDALLRDAAEAFGPITGRMDPGLFDQAIEAAANARRLVLVASGITQFHCQDAAFAFNTIGRPAEFHPDAMAQQVLAEGLGPEDVCLAVSISGSNALTLKAADIAATTPATLIGATCFANTRLKQIADIPVVVSVTGPAPGNHGSVAAAAMFLALRALTTGVMTLRGPASETSLHHSVSSMTAQHWEPALDHAAGSGTGRSDSKPRTTARTKAAGRAARNASIPKSSRRSKKPKRST